MSDTALFAAPARLRRLQIEITTGCNLRCVGCQRTIGMADGTWRNAHMPMARFAAILDHAPPADVVILQGIGEPTLHPSLAEMIEAARSSAKFGLVSFNTNALVRDPDWYAALREIGLGHVSISVDSLEPESAEALRAGTDVDQLRAAIPALIQVFQGAVTFSIVLSRRNAAEVPELLGTLHALGARTVEVQPLVSYSAANDPLALDDRSLRAASAAIQSAGRALPGMTVLQGAALTPNGSRCRRPFHAAYVTVDGWLTPCCVTNDVALFGRTSLAELPFAEAWQSPGVRQFLQAYFDREPEICKGCAFNPSGATGARTMEDAQRLHRAGALDQAELAYRAWLQDGEGLHGLGLLKFQRGDMAGALPLLRAAETLSPPHPRLTYNIAAVLNQLGQAEEAAALHRRNIGEYPAYEPSYHALSAVLEKLGDPAGATAVEAVLAERALTSGADEVLAQAVAHAIELDPAHPILLRLANRLRIAGRNDAALRLLDARLERDPDDLGAALTRTMSRLTVVHESLADVATRRAAFTADLLALAQRVVQAPPEALADAAEQVGTAKPFFLSYQGQDDRDRMRVYGGIVSRMMATAHPAPKPEPAPPDPRLRVGFASAYFHLHSVSKLFGGWMKGLDRDRFAVYGYYLGEAEDATSLVLAGACERFHRGNRTDAAWVEAILTDAPHVLIYPEIGMHPTAVRLACRRLAPVQCVTWGHPVTTGLPEIDYFLSSELMEPPDGDAHYTEKLVRLPNLSICYEPLPAGTGSLTRTTLGLPDDAVVYICCQSLFKYHPRDDGLLPKIAARVAAARFLFIGDEREPNARLVKSRLGEAFVAAGLDPAAHLVFTRPVPAEEFPALLRAGDIYLDSLGWSGGNTTLEALACDLPVVTLAGPLMRGRHSAAIMRMIGLKGCVAPNEAGYVELAVALAEPRVRQAVRAEIGVRKSRLYGDQAPLRALEAFLLQASGVTPVLRTDEMVAF